MIIIKNHSIHNTLASDYYTKSNPNFLMRIFTFQYFGLTSNIHARSWPKYLTIAIKIQELD